jgi:hypothetical protein
MKLLQRRNRLARETVPGAGGRAMGKTAKRSDPELWEAVKAEVTRGSKGGRPGEWSARKAQLAAHLYKARGGGYEGAPATARRGGELTWEALYAEARRRNLPGRSKMTKAELEAALS